MSVENAILKAIAKQWEKTEFPVGQVAFKGEAVIELDIDVSRKADIEALPKFEFPFKKVLATALNKLGLSKEEIYQVVLDLATDSTPMEDENIEVIEEFIDKAVEEAKKKTEREKVKKASPTLIRGVVRLKKFVAKKR